MGILADLDYALERLDGSASIVIHMNPGAMHALAAECLASYEARKHRGIPIVTTDQIDGWEIAEVV